MLEYYQKCENSLKKRIVLYFKPYIQESALDAFMKKEYIDDEVQKINKLNDVFNYLLDNMLNDLINVETKRHIQIDEKTYVDVTIGTIYKNAVINYLKIMLARKINFKPQVDFSHAREIDYIYTANRIFKDIITENTFKKNIDELSQIDEISPFIQNTILYDIEKCLNKPQQNSYEQITFEELLR